MKKPTRTPLTAEQLADAKRLQDIYNRRVEESRANGGPLLTQTEVGERCEWKSAQSTVSQYMTGKVALNLEALIKLASALDFEPAEVSPSLASGVARVRGAGMSGPLEDDYVLIPQYRMSAHLVAGQDSFVEEKSDVVFRREWLRGRQADPKNLALIRVSDNVTASSPRVVKLVLIDKSLTDPMDAKIYLLEAEGVGAFIGRLQSSPEGWMVLDEEHDSVQDQNPSAGACAPVNFIHGRVIWRGSDV